MIVYVDIDDTICYCPENMDKLDYTNRIPYHDRIQRLNVWYKTSNITLVYWTARGTLTGKNWFQITYEQLKEWGCKFDELRMGKPAYDLFIDDKNINSEVFFASK